MSPWQQQLLREAPLKRNASVNSGKVDSIFKAIFEKVTVNKASLEFFEFL